MERQSSKETPPAPSAQPRSNARLAMGTVRSAKVQIADPELEEPGDRPRPLGPDDLAQLVHDLRDPLATIALEIYVLDRKLAVGDHSNVRSTSARIIRNVEHLDRLIGDLLDLCCAGTRGLELVRRPTELRALLEQVIDRTVPPRDRHRVVLDAPYPLTLPIDSMRIERVVGNLIGNALKHAPPGGPIRVQLEAGSLAARISVASDGPAVPPAGAAHGFERPRSGPHAQGIDAHQLGLYVSKQLVEAHGGRLTVDRAPDGGESFSFELPVPPR